MEADATIAGVFEQRPLQQRFPVVGRPAGQQRHRVEPGALDIDIVTIVEADCELACQQFGECESTGTIISPVLRERVVGAILARLQTRAHVKLDLLNICPEASELFPRSRQLDHPLRAIGEAAHVGGAQRFGERVSVGHFLRRGKRADSGIVEWHQSDSNRWRVVGCFAVLAARHHRVGEVRRRRWRLGRPER